MNGVSKDVLYAPTGQKTPVDLSIVCKKCGQTVHITELIPQDVSKMVGLPQFNTMGGRWCRVFLFEGHPCTNQLLVYSPQNSPYVILKRYAPRMFDILLETPTLEKEESDGNG